MIGNKCMRNMWKNTDSKVLMEQKREYNNSFDLVKFWCSYIVISIHCGLRNGREIQQISLLYSQAQGNINR